MTHPSQATVTRLLHELQEGNRTVGNELFRLVYDELHARAHGQRADWHGDHTLNTTALVHEAYLKLVDRKHETWKSRAHFLAVAAKAMRHILVDYARRRRAEKRGGNVQKLSLEEMKGALEDLVVMTEERADALVALEEALERLARVNKREVQALECRYFGGMTIKQTAEALGVGERTVKRDCAMAQAWLHREIHDDLRRR